MEICVSKSIGLPCSGKEIYHFCFVLLCIRGQIPSNGGFFALRFLGGLYLEGLIHGGAYFRNFTVTVSILPEVMYHLVKDSVKGID